MGRRKNKIPKNLSFMGKIFRYIHVHVHALNNSKIFAGLMIITLNIVSKFANFKLSKTLEAYFKFTFSRQVLVFAIAWMGTRDIYIALFITLCFTIVTEHLFHEESPFFVLSEDFRDYHINLLDNEHANNEITKEDIIKAKSILERAKEQKLLDDIGYQSYPI
uniref:Uncharacterized protein n=1 Tax=viral metagenome TaxID=1070528 RepID=A0A6C0ARZ5_9ZZZZ